MARMIERQPHPVYAVLWLAWSVYMVVCLFVAPGLADVILWATWAGIEGTAAKLNTGMRDTQSELATWVHRHLAKGPLATVPYRGWNAILFTPYIGAIGLNLFQLFQGRGFVMETSGALFAIIMAVGLNDHWLQPEVHG